MREIPITQFLRPDGEVRSLVCDVADDVADIYEGIIKPYGLRVTAECLRDSPIVSLCLEEPKLGDFICALATNSKEHPELVRDALESMIRKFDIEEFEFWKSTFDDDELEDSGL